MLIGGLLTLPLFGIAFAMKGGQTAKVIDDYEDWRSRSRILDRLLDGKVISTLVVGAYMWIVFFFVKDQGLVETLQNTLLFCLGWLGFISPAIRNEYLACKNKGFYVGSGLGKKYGMKKFLQRAVFGGACLALATGFTGYILAAGLLYVPIVYVLLNSIDDGDKAWALSEPLVGAFVVGLPTHLWLV